MAKKVDLAKLKAAAEESDFLHKHTGAKTTCSAPNCAKNATFVTDYFSIKRGTSRRHVCTAHTAQWLKWAATDQAKWNGSHPFNTSDVHDDAARKLREGKPEVAADEAEVAAA